MNAMVALGSDLIPMIGSTILDVLPILSLITFFQLVVLRNKMPNVRKIVFGAVLVVLGLSFFLVGLSKALFPIGDTMARQLSDPAFLQKESGIINWKSYYWMYLFAAAMGFSSSLAEPSVLAVAIKAREVSSGAINEWGLRIMVALGVAFALALGVFRIVTGTPLHLYILAGYIIVIIQTIFAPRQIIALAYDAGGVTTSTVIVPLIAAMGLGLSVSVEGRNPLTDGFGLVALACLFPIITVMGYAQISELKRNISRKN
jgi:Protein of unknown function (DUF1538)